MTDELTQWLLNSGEPWTLYRTLVDLLDQPAEDPRVQAARTEMLAHPHLQAMMAEAATWPGYALKRHNDARHPIYKFSTLADFGVQADDPGMAPGLDAVLAHQSPEGPFQSVIHIPQAFGGTGEDMWSWVLCDAPTLLYALLAMGLGDHPRVQQAVNHLVDVVDDNGWHCVADARLGRFKGPGRRSDPCPIVNVYALKALSQVRDLVTGPAAHTGVEMLLGHWSQRKERKYFLFGMGTDFRKLKYPFVWYDILHVVDVLSRFPFVHVDPRFQEMVEALTAQGDETGRYTATSMYRAWKGWTFADKKQPSPWLTFLALRIQKRLGQLGD
jgi:hypothetical protein